MSYRANGPFAKFWHSSVGRKMAKFAYLPGRTFLSNISTKLSLSGRDCSWKKPSACPEKVFFFFFFFISYLFCKHVFRITFTHEVDDKNWCVDLPISWTTMPLIQHPRARVMFCRLPVLPSCEEHLSIYLKNYSSSPSGLWVKSP